MSALIREQIRDTSQIVICPGTKHVRKSKEGFIYFGPFSNATMSAARSVPGKQMQASKKAAKKIFISLIEHSRLSR